MHSMLIRFARSAKQLAFTVLKRTGSLRLISASAWRQSKLLILCYHGVSIVDEHEWDPELFVTPAFLRRRFEILKAGRYVVLPLEDALRRCAAGTLPPRSVVLTFDDGLADFSQIVAPMLAEFGFPATVYVTTYYSDRQWPVPPPILSYLLWKAGRSVADLNWPETGIRATSVTNFPEYRRQVFFSILDYAEAKQMSGAERWELTQSLARRLKVDLDTVLKNRILHIMTNEEISEVSRAGFDVQLHTHRHRVPRDKLMFEAEIIENRDRLERLTGVRGLHFCYPSGIVFCEFLPWLKDLGVTSAVTCEPGLLSCKSNQMIAPRFVDTSLHSEAAFESWLSGAGALFRMTSRFP